VFGTGYSLSRSNIVLWAIDALRRGDSLIIVNDQFRAPTWADDLAKGCMLILEKDKTGIFHISGPESFSIAEIVRKIAQYVNAPIDLIRETSSAELNQKAPRPPRTGFDLSKAKEELGYAPLAFEEALKVLDEELKSNVYSNPQ
jgi:dTDP-4-dehydrorhamnose reductase